MTQITDALQDFNLWWKGEFKCEFKYRDIYKQIQKFISLRQIIAFTGIRRVGKTTLMYKIITDFIERGFKAFNILYFSFDDFKDIRLNELIKEYEVLVNVDFRKDKFLLLFDEVQKLNDWENQVKRLYDTYSRNIKIVISGSESLFIRKESKETLAGRIFEFKVDVLSFEEFLLFKNIKLKVIDLYKKELLNLFREYTLTLGFPELINIKDKEIIRKYIKDSIIDKVIYRDIPKLFNIKDVSILESIFNLFLDNPGQLLEISTLASELGISRQTLSIYLTYLENSFFIRKLYNFSKSRRKVERKLKKYYPMIISTNLLFKEDIVSKSKVFEWLVVNQLKAEFFWRDPYKNEVDIVLVDKGIIPIEVKYGDLDFKGMLAFMKKFNVDKGYIISFDKEDTKNFNDKLINVVPAFKFLLKSKYY